MSRGFRDADATQQVSSREADEALSRLHAAAELQALHAAELRAQGASGLCEVCGQEIGKERMEALPDATRCISCQAEWEAGQGRA